MLFMPKPEQTFTIVVERCRCSNASYVAGVCCPLETDVKRVWLWQQGPVYACYVSCQQSTFVSCLSEWIFLYSFSCLKLTDQKTCIWLILCKHWYTMYFVLQVWGLAELKITTTRHHLTILLSQHYILFLYSKQFPLDLKDYPAPQVSDFWQELYLVIFWRQKEVIVIWDVSTDVLIFIYPLWSSTFVTNMNSTTATVKCEEATIQTSLCHFSKSTEKSPKNGAVVFFSENL